MLLLVYLQSLSLLSVPFEILIIFKGHKKTKIGLKWVNGPLFSRMIIVDKFE